jgi:excinuclease ABC subunit A
MSSRRTPFSDGALRIHGACIHNLKDVSVSFPLGCITCVTGVSGSGKSSLVLHTLYRGLIERLHGEKPSFEKAGNIEGGESLGKVVLVDQAPLGRTPRSNPATYTGLFALIRRLFSQIPDARARGYGPERFSFNVKGGRCEACKGEGLQRIDMVFLPDVYVTCSSCGGTRYAPETLDIRFKGSSIAEVLEMSVVEAAGFFENVPSIRNKLSILEEVGLGYLRLGQPATTLSGGEAQRIKLGAELARKSSSKALYILDEPTTGLHFDDIRKLLHVLQRLVDLGHTIIMIEHHPDVIKTADYVVDLGPEGGEEGGHVVASGTPREVAGVEGSATGKYLREAMARACKK